MHAEFQRRSTPACIISEDSVVLPLGLISPQRKVSQFSINPTPAPLELKLGMCAFRNTFELISKYQLCNATLSYATV